MKKYSLALLTSILLSTLTACGDSNLSLNEQEFSSELRALNSALYRQSDLKINELPFTEAYLERRHSILSNKLLSSNVAIHSELDYLRIQQRYPERYLPWPGNVPVVTYIQEKVSTEVVDKWFLFVKSKLVEASESNIRLNRLEHQGLLEQLTSADIALQSRDDLISYLNSYKPRAMLGLHQLPNGKEWYQSKLNFYGSIKTSPNKVLANLTKLTVHDTNTVPLVMPNLHRPYILELLPDSCKRLEGLNWRDGFVNLPASVAKCKQVRKQHKMLLLTIMEVDLGLHYQGWSQQQAFVVLNSRLALNEQQAQQLIANIVYFPATIFAAYPHFLQP